MCPKALQYLEEGQKVVVFAAGTGEAAFFTTDTAAALRGAEIDASGSEGHQGGWRVRPIHEGFHSDSLRQAGF